MAQVLRELPKNLSDRFDPNHAQIVLRISGTLLTYIGTNMNDTLYFGEKGLATPPFSNHLAHQAEKTEGSMASEY